MPSWRLLRLWLPVAALLTRGSAQRGFRRCSITSHGGSVIVNHPATRLEGALGKPEWRPLFGLMFAVIGVRASVDHSNSRHKHSPTDLDVIVNFLLASGHYGAATTTLTGRLVFDHEFDIWTMNADGTDRVRLTDHPAEDFDPVWSPDGTMIAFRSHRDGNEEIYVMAADGSGQRNVTMNPAT